MASAGVAEGDRQLDMRSRIEEDREASELLIALFMSASMSYKYHSLVRPCPPDYSEMSSSLHESTVSQEKQREVVSVLEELNKLKTLQDIPPHTPLHSLIEWIVLPRRVSVRGIPASMYNRIIQATSPTGYRMPAPRAIFEVSYPDRESLLAKDCILAYHGSRLENFHSILHNGLSPLFAKERSLFGQGIYLGLDLAISIDYSPQGSFGWSKSILGEKLSCVAVCYVDKKAWSSSKKNSPESYIVVDSNADIQLKYLLVYSERTKHRSGVTNILQQNKFAFSLLFYIIILVLVSLYRR